jgi:RNA polymerase sigma factor (TIGR02999 family)
VRRSSRIDLSWITSRKSGEIRLIDLLAETVCRNVLLMPDSVSTKRWAPDQNWSTGNISGPSENPATPEKETLDQLVPVVYAQLRTLAHQRLRKAVNERSLNTTGLVHEAYLRLIDAGSAGFKDRDHFLAFASRVMRSVLVDNARKRTAAKRGSGAALGELHEENWVTEVDNDRVTELDEALTRLERLDDRQARMVEQRYFGGLSLEEIATTMNVSLATVKRDLRSARAWLGAELNAE